MDRTPTTTAAHPELTRYRNGAIVFLLSLIIGALGIFGVVSANQSASTSERSDIRTCQLSAVVGGASLKQAETVCGHS